MIVQSPLNARIDRLQRRRDSWRDAELEPSLEEVLLDPSIHAVMSSDGLMRMDLDLIIALGRSMLRERPCSRAPRTTKA